MSEEINMKKNVRVVKQDDKSMYENQVSMLRNAGYHINHLNVIIYQDQLTYIAILTKKSLFGKKKNSRK